MTEPPVRSHRRRSGRPAPAVGAAVVVVLVLAGVAGFAGYHRRSAPASATAAEVTPAATAPASAPVATSPSASAKPRSKAPTAKPPAASKQPAGFTLTWRDDFAGGKGTGLNRKTYRYDTGPGSKFGTGEIETMTDSTRNVFHDGQGHLVLRALHSGGDPAQGWTSGRFETEAATFGAAKGGVVRIEASIRQPDVGKGTGAGYWPAFWMLGNGLRSGGTWPGTGEVDILENVNGRDSVFGTLHCGVNPGGPCNESTGIGHEQTCAGCRGGFHTYAVEIDRSTATEQIRWLLDGRTYFTLKQSKVPGKTWTDAVDHPFFIIFDLAVGGGFPAAFGGGPNAATTSGGAMTIDYVAVYNRR